MNMYNDLEAMRIIVEQHIAELHAMTETERMLRQVRSEKGAHTLWQQLSKQLHRWYGHLSPVRCSIEPKTGGQTCV